ncbi:hypothetical protein ACAG20_02485, partial [Mycobacterium sp. pW045]
MPKRLVTVASVVANMFGAVLLFFSPASNAMPLRCTNMINYAGDPRGNAEINGIGWQTGECPAPTTGSSSAMPLRCTNMINYAGDPRGNAEINGIGWQTG